MKRRTFFKAVAGGLAGLLAVGQTRKVPDSDAYADRRTINPDMVRRAYRVEPWMARENVTIDIPREKRYTSIKMARHPSFSEVRGSGWTKTKTESLNGMVWETFTRT